MRKLHVFYITAQFLLPLPIATALKRSIHKNRSGIEYPVFLQKSIKIRIQTLRKVVGKVIRSVVHRNGRRVGRRLRCLASGVGKGQSVAAIRVDPHGS